MLLLCNRACEHADAGEEREERQPLITFTVGIDPWVSKATIRAHLEPTVATHLQSVTLNLTRAILTFSNVGGLRQALGHLCQHNGFYALDAESLEP